MHCNRHTVTHSSPANLQGNRWLWTCLPYSRYRPKLCTTRFTSKQTDIYRNRMHVFVKQEESEAPRGKHTCLEKTCKLHTERDKEEIKPVKHWLVILPSSTVFKKWNFSILPHAALTETDRLAIVVINLLTLQLWDNLCNHLADLEVRLPPTCQTLEA